MKRRLPLAVWFLSLAALVFIGLWLAPRLLGFYDLMRAGRLLDRARTAAEIAKSESFVCEPLQMGSDGQPPAWLSQSIHLLQRTILLDSASAQTYRLMGQAYCMLGKPDEAVKSLEKYVHLRPKNPLGLLELGFAYEASCRNKNIANMQTSVQASAENPCLEGATKARITQNWQAAGANAAQMFARADQAFASQQYDEAITWFQRAGMLGGKPTGYQQFKWAVSDVLTGQPLPETLDGSNVPIYSVSGDLKINGEDLQWLRLEDPSWNAHNGERLSVYPTSDPTIGAMWFQGSAVAILQVPCSSIYRVSIRAKHVSPQNQAGELQIEKDLSPSGTFSVSGDWQEFETETYLTEGLHMIGVHYLQDIGDAFIQWLQINNTTECKS
jgi:tetratricopeptide (TPR) repeat protein